MFYSSTSLTDTCCNSNVQFVDNSSYHVSWYAPDLPSYVVLQICHDLGLLSQILSLRYPQRKQSHGFRPGEQGGQGKLMRREMSPSPGKYRPRNSKDLSEQWGGAPCCWQITVFISTLLFLLSARINFFRMSAM